MPVVETVPGDRTSESGLPGSECRQDRAGPPLTCFFLALSLVVCVLKHRALVGGISI